MIHRIAKIWVVYMLVVFLGSCSNPTIPTHKVIRMVGARNARYCEILLVKGNNPLKLVASVYNTLGCNECPDSIWKNINPEKIKQEVDAKNISLNGPRFFLMDSIGQFNVAPARVTLGGIELVERATISIDLKTVLQGKIKAYHERVIKRSTKYVFNKGSLAYFLIHNGDRYIMQSYSLMVNPQMNEAKLTTLANELHLPEGWKFASEMLDKPIVLETNNGGKAYLIQDEYQNSYQKIN